MIPTDELNELPLPDGGMVVASVAYDPGIRVTRLDAESCECAALQLDYPSAGFGGAGWVTSPSGTLLILHYYSGQSEEAFALISLADNGLTLIANSGYQFGEYASYAFSPTEEQLVMALPHRCDEWWANWEDDGLEIANDGVAVLHIATLLLCSTSSGKLNRTKVELVPTVAHAIDKGGYDPDLTPGLITNCEVSLRFPWAKLTLDLSSAPARIRIPYPSSSTG